MSVLLEDYVINEDDTARFALGKYVDNPLVVFGINPSTAAIVKNDPTISIVEKIAKKRGHDGYLMLNIYPVRATKKEIGLENGATISEILTHIPQTGLKACAVSIGLFLRLAWTDQPQSQNSILSGTHDSPDQAVTVLSEILEQDDAYRFPGDAMFAFENDTIYY